MKILFVGHPGSGKTYAATKLARSIGTTEIDIDDLLHNWIYFLFTSPYRKAFAKLLSGKSSWIIDGYGGKRMPPTIWDEADHIVYINLPKSELRQNIYNRYKHMKATKESTHGQHLFTNYVKNLWQIYVLDSSLENCAASIRHSSNTSKLTEVHSREELDDCINELTSYE